MNYKVIFDLEQQSGFTLTNLPQLESAFVLLLIGCWSIVTRNRRMWLRGVPALPRAFYIVLTGGAALMLLVFARADVSEYTKWRELIRDGEVAEGTMRHTVLNSGAKLPCVQHACLPFSHSDKEIFNRGFDIANDLPDGVPVRVTYNHNIITRVEVGNQ